MKRTANAYSSRRGIGPSLHDWEREKEDLAELKREAREETFNREFYWWHINMYCERQKDNAKKEIAETMSIALNNLYCNEEDCSKFEQALFATYCNHGDEAGKEVIWNLLDQYLKQAIRSRMEKDEEERIAALAEEDEARHYPYGRPEHDTGWYWELRWIRPS